MKGSEVVAQGMAVILKTGRERWGWGSWEEPRFHLQLLPRSRSDNRFAKVWLEVSSTRAFEPCDVPRKSEPKLVKQLRDELNSEFRQERPEWAWAQFMVQKRWVQLCLVGHVLHVIAYPGHNDYTREVDLKKRYPGIYPSAQCRSIPPRPGDVGIDAENSWIEIYKKRPEDQRIAMDLGLFLFKGER